MSQPSRSTQGSPSSEKSSVNFFDEGQNLIKTAHALASAEGSPLVALHALSAGQNMILAAHFLTLPHVDTSVPGEFVYRYLVGPAPPDLRSPEGMKSLETSLSNLGFPPTKSAEIATIVKHMRTTGSLLDSTHGRDLTVPFSNYIDTVHKYCRNEIRARDNRVDLMDHVRWMAYWFKDLKEPTPIVEGEQAPKAPKKSTTRAVR